jgi:uncharacterized delta-60 repeat protein
MLLFRKALLLASLLFIAAIGIAQVTEKWVKRQNGDANANDMARGLVVDCKGNIIVTGFADGEEFQSNSNFATIKYNDDGDIKWIKKYNGPGNGTDEATAITTDSKGNIYVTGWSTGNGTNRDFTTIKYDDDGHTKWVKRYNGPANEIDEALAIAVDDNGNVYVTGTSTGSGTAEDITTIKYDDDGDTKWVRRYNGSANGRDEPTVIAVDKNGNVYVAGWSTRIETYSDITTIKYNDDGDLKWVSQYNGPINQFDRANDLALDENGNVYVTGSIATRDIEDFGIISDIATIKYNALGQQQWVTVFSREGHDEGNALAVDASGNVFISGITEAVNGFVDFVTIKYNSAGVQLWSAFFEGAGRDDDGLVHDLVLDKAGNVYITGALPVYIINALSFLNQTNYATVKYNNNGEQQWAATYDGPGNASDIAFAAGLDNNGNVYITGRSQIDNFDFATIKYDANGVKKWVKRYNGQNDQIKGGPDVATALALDKEGNVHVTGGITRLITGSDYTTYKYDSDANRIWKKTYNGPGIGPDRASAITVDANGSVFITGASEGGATQADYATVKYDKNGDTKWVRRYNGPANATDQPAAIAADENGNVYVTGMSVAAGPNGDYATIKYDKNGNTIWIKRYNGPENTFDGATAIAVDKQGNVYVTGESGSGSTVDYATIKYDANGNELWVARYNGPGNSDDAANALVLDAAGNVYVTGQSRGINSLSGFATIKYNSAGVQQWVARYDSPINFSLEGAKDIAIDASGNVYVTGESQGDYTTIKYNAAGVQQWLAAYNGGIEDISNALALDTQGNVYVTGSSRSPGNFSRDYATVKYNAAGVQQWEARYEGPGLSEDIATDIAVDGDGHVYVTGHSQGSETSTDYATIKYQQISGNERISQPVITHGELPANFRVNLAPNPAAVTTKIFYELPFEGRVSIEIFDLSGRQVSTLVNATKPAGFHNTDFNVTTLQKGVYVYRIKVKTAKREWSQTGKINVIR